MSSPCIDENHFQINADGSIQPQPWMQYRCVGTASYPSKAHSYAATTSVNTSFLTGLGSVSLGTLYGGISNAMYSLLGGSR